MTTVLVAYGSRLGSTRGIAERIAARLRTHGIDTTACDVQTGFEPGRYDAFVIGSAVYAGHWLKDVTRRVGEHTAVLSARPVWLFSSGPVGKLATGSAPVAPAEVRGLESAVNAREHRIFAGALDRGTVDGARFGTAERFIAKRFVPEGDYRDWTEIDTWADSIAHSLNAVHAVPV